MTTTINASTSTGLVSTADTSGILKVQSNGVTTNALAWANFNGTGSSGSATVNNSYNVSSITYTGTGDATINFTNAMANANYVVSGIGQYDQANAVSMASGIVVIARFSNALQTGSARIWYGNFGTFNSNTIVTVVFFGT